MPKSESVRASEDRDEWYVNVEERLENILRRLGLEGKGLDGMKWVYFCYNYFRMLTL